MLRTTKYIFLLILSGILLSCSSSQQSANSAPHQSNISEYYTSAFPHNDVSGQLQQIQQSIIRIVTTGYYYNYTFDKKYITLNDVRTNDPGDIASSTYSSEESTAGTSIILDHNEQSSLLLTCEHTISFPDTVISYYEGEDIPDNTFIESISIKINQSNLVHTTPNLKSFEVMATDERTDLALLRINHRSDKKIRLQSLRIQSGDSDLLQLGSFLYILGFPKGYSMVTRGLASASDSWRERYFVADALFNPGISGGLIIASKDNFDSFQWVGMARSANASREDVLVPRPDPDKYSRAPLPYKDSLFVQQKTRINYGITQAIPINKIKDFLYKNEQLISSQGFSLRTSRFSR